MHAGYKMIHIIVVRGHIAVGLLVLRQMTLLITIRSGQLEVTGQVRLSRVNVSHANRERS